jgi:large subunit ribosomal protein L23
MSILNKLKLKKKNNEAQINIEKTDSISPVTHTSVRYGVSVNQRTHPRQSTFLIKQAWITEKAGDLSGLRKYIFIIDKKANKSETKKAIESIYGVKVKSVNIIEIKGKAKRLGRSLGRTSAHKKAIVTLKEGDKIDLMPT